MIKIFGKVRYHWQPELAWAVIYWSMAVAPVFIGLSLLYEKARIPNVIFILFLIFIVLFGVGFHRYFVLEEGDLRIASANTFRKSRIAIASIEKVEVSVLSITLYSSDYPSGLSFCMRKWPKKYFINDLARHTHFRGEVELVDHLKKQDYFEVYYSEKAKSVR
ncbi:EbsA family protein [Streptococcus suis]|uniref:EbsA protein n=1 Tax=Streptococcus suis TaxID=1307 RepID=A0A4V4RX38_STRSU|nr:EbsA family protein [Streptococcus suis]MBM7269236.1 EbsA family protein [Streptococcus suis]TII01265.1 EbsA protein [Streptococcus suis]